MYGAVSAAPAAPSRSGGVLPLAAICCLGTLALLIAVTIVLALIPVYLPAKSITPATSTSNNTFQLQYSSTSVGADRSVSGTINNLDEVRAALGLGNDVALDNGFAKATFQRRRRSVLNRRQKRAVGISIGIQGRYLVPGGCFGQCQTTFVSRVNVAIAAVTSFSNVPCQIGYGTTVVRFSLSLSFVGIVQQVQRLPGYGPVSSLGFVAASSGSILNPLTWLGNVVPFVGCGVTVPVGINLLIPLPSLIIPLASINVVFGATLSVGVAGTAGFSFSARIALTISGVFSFSGAGGAFVLPYGSSFIFSQGATFIGTAITVQILDINGNVGVSVVVSTTTTFLSIVPGANGGYSVNTPTTTAVTSTTRTTTAVTSTTTTTTAVTANIGG